MKFDDLYKLITEGSAVRSYSCLMLDLSMFSEEMDILHESICPCDIYDDEPGHGLEKEVHTTVMYGIDPRYRPEEVYNSIGLMEISLKLKGLSLFENEKFDVLKFDVASKDLHDLHNEVSENINCPGNKYPKYHPHVTVSYLKPGTGKYYIKTKSDIIGERVTANRFIFSNQYSEKVYWNV